MSPVLLQMRQLMVNLWERAKMTPFLALNRGCLPADIKHQTSICVDAEGIALGRHTKSSVGELGQKQPSNR